MKTEVSSVPWRFDCDSPSITFVNDESDNLNNEFGIIPYVKQEFNEDWSPNDMSNDNEWEKIAGAENIKCKVYQIITRLIDYKEFKKTLEETLFEVSLLLFGPPGCGKTFLSKIIANDVGAEFVCIKTDELVKQFELKKCEFLENYEQASNIVIFLDNFEDILEANDTLRRNIFFEINLMSQTKNVITIAATEKIFKITPILEKYSFSQLVYVPLPDERLGEEMLKININEKSINKAADLQQWSRKLENYSFDDINKICRVLKTSVNVMSNTDILRKGGMPLKMITSKQFMQTVMLTTQSTPDDEISQYREFASALKELKTKQLASIGPSISPINDNGVQILSAVDFLLITNKFLRSQKARIEEELTTERSKKKRLTKTLKRSKSREKTMVNELETFCKNKFEELEEKRFKIEKVETEFREKLESFFSNFDRGN